MASIQDIYGNADTLKAADLPHGVQVPVIIETVRPIAFDDGNKIEIRFRGKKKVLICNKTNAIRIAAQHGDDYEAWPAKPVFLQRDQTEFRGSLVDCVRVCPAAATAAPVPQQQPPVEPGRTVDHEYDQARDSNQIPF